MQTSFINNYADIKGGALHWDTVEPFFGGVANIGNTSTLTYKGNKAGMYGDSISCFPQQIAIINQSDY